MRALRDMSKHCGQAGATATILLLFIWDRLFRQAVPGLGPMDDPRRDKLRIQQRRPQLSVESELNSAQLGMAAPVSKLRTLVIGNVGHDLVC